MKRFSFISLFHNFLYLILLSDWACAGHAIAKNSDSSLLAGYDVSDSHALSELRSTPYTLEIVRSSEAKEKISNLQIEPEMQVPVLVDSVSKEAFISVSLVHRAKDYTLLFDSKRLKPESETKVLIQIKKPIMLLDFMEISPLGEVVTEKVVLKFQQWNQWKMNREEVTESSVPSWNFSLGPSWVSYRETLQSDFSQVVLTAKGGYQRPINTKWSAAAGGFVTVLPLATSEPDHRIQFVGLNFRLGYALPWLPKPWSLSLMGGGYYTTTFSSSPTQFGFQNMSGGQVFPVLGRTLSSASSMSLYFKYALVSSGFNLGFQGKEIATGIGYTHQVALNRAITIGLDLAQFNMNIEDLLFIESQSISLGIGYKW